MGPHPYMSKVDVFDRLRDPIGWEAHRDPQNESMRLGVFFERRIAQYASLKLGLKLRSNSRTIEHQEFPLCATPDFLVLNARMLVECKLSSIMYGWDEDTLQSHIDWQARAQLAVTDRDVCIVAALVGSRFYSVPVIRDDSKERMMLIAVQEMMHDVRVGNRPPEPTKLETKVSKVNVEPVGARLLP
jgi:hypothetical protein